MLVPRCFREGPVGVEFPGHYALQSRLSGGGAKLHITALMGRTRRPPGRFSSDISSLSPEAGLATYGDRSRFSDGESREPSR